MNLQTALENMEFFSYHGLYPDEKVKGGKFTVAIYIDEQCADNKEFKGINEVINYELVYEIAKKEMDISRDLIEEVASNILRKINMTFSSVENITVYITKHNPASNFNGANAKVRLSLK
jgi:dihydroneopterin aldolase